MCVYIFFFPPVESCQVLCRASVLVPDGSCNHRYLICGPIPFSAQCSDPGLRSYPVQMESTVNLVTSSAEHVQTGVTGLKLPRCIQAVIKNAEVSFLTPK